MLLKLGLFLTVAFLVSFLSPSLLLAQSPTRTPAPTPSFKSSIVLTPDKRATGGYVNGEEVTITFDATGGSGTKKIHTATVTGTADGKEAVKRPDWNNSYREVKPGGTRKAKVPFYLEYLAQVGSQLEATNKVSVRADSIPPASSIVLSAPKNRGYVKDEQVTVTFNATDTGSGVKRIHTTLVTGTADERAAKRKPGWSSSYREVKPGGTRSITVPFYLEYTAEDKNGNIGAVNKKSVPVGLVTITGVKVGNTPLDLSNPSATLRLPGKVEQSSQFDFLISISYSDGKTRNSSIRFNYQASLQTQGISQTKKVFLLIFNPVLENYGKKRLVELKGWNNPRRLTNDAARELKNLSHDFVDYQIVETREVDFYPVKPDGFQYTDESYITCLSGEGCHSPDIMNYQRVIADFGLCEKRNRDEIDEVWMWGGPYFGFWESNLTGPGAFYYNSSPTTGINCTKLLPIMGFNYERGLHEILENFAHRTESTMNRVYNSPFSYGNPRVASDESNAWHKFVLLDIYSPGRSGCGFAHAAANAQHIQYSWNNTRTVLSSCDDFLNYPNMTGSFTKVNCNTWGCNPLGFFKWWFYRLPYREGIGSDGKLNNWWDYIVNPNKVL